MTIRRIDPEELGRPVGWTNGILGPPGGRVLFVAGQTAARGEERDLRGRDMTDQWDGALTNVLSVVRAAGGSVEDVVRMTIYVVDLPAYRAAREAIGEVWRRHMGRHYPAASLVEVSALLDEGALVEIEATAVIQA